MVAIAPAIIYLPTEYDMDCPESEMTCYYSNIRAPGSLRLLTISTRVRHLLHDCEYWPVHSVEILARTEPLNKDSSPPHHEARNKKLRMEDKMG